ncbi:F-box domain protein [Ancylostoma caninum]|uniref:F-box domain protein n=1 Tax=Ancylostoma caninum TaxID=29170 RepID=A0A368GSY1_ANCCA|nr:F-box domain protein [Ancylostoma caninum]
MAVDYEAVTFPFLDLPQEIQLEILSKLPAADTNRFRCTSSAMYSMVEGNRMSLARRRVNSVSIAPNWAELVPKRRNIPSAECLDFDESEFGRLFRACDISMLHIVNFDFTQRFVESLISLMVKNRIRIAQFNFGICHFSCDSSTFCQLLPAVSLTELCIMTSSATQSDFSAQILASAEAKQLNRLAIGFPSEVSDDYLLSSKLSWLAVTDTTISCAAIRIFVLEWLQGKRSFDYVGLTTNCRLEARIILAGMSFCQVDAATFMLKNCHGQKMAVAIEENSFVMYNKTAERIMCEFDS